MCWWCFSSFPNIAGLYAKDPTPAAAVRPPVPAYETPEPYATLLAEILKLGQEQP